MRTKGAAGHTIWQELRLLWEENLIRAGDIKTVDDERGTNLRIYGLTDQGWKRLDELASQIRRPVRSWVARHSVIGRRDGDRDRRGRRSRCGLPRGALGLALPRRHWATSPATYPGGIDVMCQEQPLASKSFNHFVGAQQWLPPIPSLESRG
jgi:hypothetical protein